MYSNWRPSASIEQLRHRGLILQQIRQFFAERQVLEVETPAMSQATVTDPHLHTFSTRFVGPGRAEGQKLYLQTSPEFHMKRLLCAGSGCIYQMGRAFRNEESGRFHNPEFTMLEWYRVGFDHHDLMQEVDVLLQRVLRCGESSQITYQAVFQQYLKLDPLNSCLTELKTRAGEYGFADIAAIENDSDTLLQLLFSHCIEPQIGQQSPVMIYNFPASQAALARISQQDERVAERFEVYYKGIELANGFHELSDSDEQARRFDRDNTRRQQLNLSAQPIDGYLLAALSAGLPDCAGVALGIDRLVMLALQVDHLDQVLAFPVQRS